jgi:hypothetical protein
MRDLGTMAPTTRSSKNVFVTTCFLLAALIAFQITREDPETTASFSHADVAKLTTACIAT